MNYDFFIGIDVSKNTLDFAVSEGKELLLQTTISNELSGIREFWNQLKSIKGFFFSAESPPSGTLRYTYTYFRTIQDDTVQQDKLWIHKSSVLKCQYTRLAPV